MNIALLRAINVGGRNKVPMAELRKVLGKLGLTDVRTLLQSGNVVYRGDATEADMQAALNDHLGVDVRFFVRTAAEWRRLVVANPYADVAKTDPGHLLVLFNETAPKAADVKALQAAIKGREVVKAVGRQLYVCYPDGIGRSKLNMQVIERKLGIAGTGRNWNTVTKLAGLVSA